ncbi:MAG: hypothetical protein JWO81_1772 [Alphaproteobacteria bacterium]|nr:hypothetical protein [Alphaproteobacteria bacterium]
MRTFIAAAAAAALLTATAAPAGARDWRHHRHDDGVGSVVGGAILIGGIAAIASAITQGNRAKQDAAVEGCAAEAESRTGARVADIGHVGKSKGYYTVQGSLDGAEGGARRAFTCTIRNGSIYSFRTDADGA